MMRSLLSVAVRHSSRDALIAFLVNVPSIVAIGLERSLVGQTRLVRRDFSAAVVIPLRHALSISIRCNRDTFRIVISVPELLLTAHAREILSIIHCARGAAKCRGNLSFLALGGFSFRCFDMGNDKFVIARALSLFPMLHRKFRLKVRPVSS